MKCLPTMLVLAAITAPAVLADGSADRNRAVERGHDLYRIYCRNCHGEAGGGDGPTAEVLTVRPPDLTRLEDDAEEGFPSDEVYATIDGRGDALAHGQSGMPIWGLAFQELNSDVDQEEQVKGRILALVEYLKSIQVGNPTKK